MNIPRNAKVSLFGEPNVRKTFVVFNPASKEVTCTIVETNSSLRARDRAPSKSIIDKRLQIIRLDDSRRDLTEMDK